MRTATGKTRRGTARATPADKTVEQSFGLAREAYGALGVDVNAALDRLASVPIGMHCRQGDDVGGFESAGAELGGGLSRSMSAEFSANAHPDIKKPSKGYNTNSYPKKDMAP